MRQQYIVRGDKPLRLKTEEIEFAGWYIKDRYADVERGKVIASEKELQQ